MKRAASFLAFIALAAALTIGVGAQQQTFSTAHAGPTGPVPVITGQPVNGDIYPYYPYPCASGGKGGRPGVNPNPNPNPRGSGGKNRNSCTGARPSARPSGRPSPRPTR
jgi:hypothetical protein